LDRNYVFTRSTMNTALLDQLLSRLGQWGIPSDTTISFNNSTYEIQVSVAGADYLDIQVFRNTNHLCSGELTPHAASNFISSLLQLQ
jgi:hypothetical protein